jgi:hypothetical protein
VCFLKQLISILWRVMEVEFKALQHDEDLRQARRVSSLWAISISNKMQNQAEMPPVLERTDFTKTWWRSRACGPSCRDGGPGRFPEKVGSSVFYRECDLAADFPSTLAGILSRVL